MRSLRLVIGLKFSRQYFSQLEARPKAICNLDARFSPPLSKLHVIARNSHRFIALFASVVIVRSNNFGFGFSTAI